MPMKNQDGKAGGGERQEVDGVVKEVVCLSFITTGQTVSVQSFFQVDGPSFKQHTEQYPQVRIKSFFSLTLHVRHAVYGAFFKRARKLHSQISALKRNRKPRKITRHLHFCAKLAT